ncbi:helix-turn-helix domain-containing protein [Plebeiibacterium marinum]|uniref:Helix-turn-helix domain-containing protein n=1 Tax=Plebeiibacterium marinum TaxID=2992111 RepID=A0AAE3MG19_9BACT|nr:helix-turn-helix domain-containing protein [Plebeiobacterium marinum]MCW3806791.1 helix-turn-helix domain-containing protein [Plebeiobacterium marinum]
MSAIYRIETVDDYNKMVEVETLHPLVNIIDFSQLQSHKNTDRKEWDKYSHLYFGIYAIYFKEGDCGKVEYGRNKYDYKEGTLLFISPGQVVKIKRSEQENSKTGWVLIFHPDLLLSSSLSKIMHDYSFFSYESNEALHVSQRERSLVFESFAKIGYEINERIDKHSKKLIINSIQMLLDYSMRFYDRQFITRENTNKGIIEQFERYLNDYFRSEKPQNIGLPSVTLIARELHLSTNYFGDLVKKETGQTALDYIHLKLISLAKEKVLDITKTISEIAFELGFKYPQHFTRMFKKSVGMSPSEYRELN